MNSEIEKAMNIIKRAMVEDDPGKEGSYAHVWHCNIAMACSDAIHAAGVVDKGLLSDSAPHAISNDAASRFMKLCFNVETTIKEVVIVYDDGITDDTEALQKIVNGEAVGVKTDGIQLGAE